MEQFCIEFGGDERTGTGERVFFTDDSMNWPPPEEMVFKETIYKRVSYSKLDPGTPGFMRGAKYLEKEEESGS